MDWAQNPCYSPPPPRSPAIARSLKVTLTSQEPLENFQSPEVFQSADLGSWTAWCAFRELFHQVSYSYGEAINMDEVTIYRSDPRLIMKSPPQLHTDQAHLGPHRVFGGRRGHGVGGKVVVVSWK